MRRLGLLSTVLILSACLDEPLLSAARDNPAPLDVTAPLPGPDTPGPNDTADFGPTDHGPTQPDAPPPMVGAPPTPVDVGSPSGATCWSAMACVVACSGDPRCFERECALKEGVEVDALFQLLECTGFCTDQGCLNGCPEEGIMCMAGGEFGSFECAFGIECGFSCEGDPFCERDCRVQMDPDAQFRYFLLWSCVAPICQGDLECQLEVAFDFCPKEADLCFNQP